MSYKIVVDSCCELTEELLKDKRVERVALELQVGDERIKDDETFCQKDFLVKVAEASECPKSSCPSPESYRQAYDESAERVYVVTLSAALSGSYNSARLGIDLLEEKKKIHVFDSKSASGGETQIVLKIMELEEQGLEFEDIVEQVEKFRDNMETYFVLDNLETLRKNGRLTGVKALVVSTLNIKPIMKAENGMIAQISQGIGNRKSLNKMVDYLIKEVKETSKKNLIITHCNCKEKAEYVRDMILEKITCKNVYILDTAGVSSMYANDGGVIVTI